LERTKLIPTQPKEPKKGRDDTKPAMNAQDVEAGRLNAKGDTKD
jgi:hypothetical protein